MKTYFFIIYFFLLFSITHYIFNLFLFLIEPNLQIASYKVRWNAEPLFCDTFNILSIYLSTLTICI